MCMFRLTCVDKYSSSLLLACDEFQGGLNACALESRNQSQQFIAYFLAFQV